MTDYWLSKLFFELQHDPQLAAQYRTEMPWGSSTIPLCPAI